MLQVSIRTQSVRFYIQNAGRATRKRTAQMVQKQKEEKTNNTMKVEGGDRVRVMVDGSQWM